MLRSLGHDRKNAVNEDIGYRFMESVTHAVHKHTARLAPMEGLVQPLGMEGDLTERLMVLLWRIRPSSTFP